MPYHCNCALVLVHFSCASAGGHQQRLLGSWSQPSLRSDPLRYFSCASTSLQQLTDLKRHKALMIKYDATERDQKALVQERKKTKAPSWNKDIRFYFPAKPIGTCVPNPDSSLCYPQAICLHKPHVIALCKVLRRESK